MSHVVSLPRVILDFEQREKVFLGVAWARFSALIHAAPDLSLPDSILLWLFCLGIDMEANLCLDMTTGGRFTHKTMTEQVTFFEHFIDKHIRWLQPLMKWYWEEMAYEDIEDSSG